MIASLRGEIAAKSEHDLVILVGDVGIKVMVPSAVSAQAVVGEKIQLLTNLVVREDSLTLFGFQSEEERELFNKLISISGVGPKTALAILSTLSVNVIISAALASRDEVFCQVPGIGKKSAQKIVLFLHDKVTQMAGREIASVYKDINAEVVDALVGLGYSVVEAQSAVQSIPKEAPDDLENRLRLALQFFST
jgi:holliday junction DNA helicase RuvA